MDFLEEVKQWVAAFPGWGEAAIHIDYVSPDPENGALLPTGLQLVDTKEDVLGTRRQRLRCAFSVQRVEHAPKQADAARLLALQQWVYDSCAAGTAPIFGEDTRWKAEKGQLWGSKGAGTAVYSLELTVEFTKIYE